jgi:AcrR family transcriptional regulator
MTTHQHLPSRIQAERREALLQAGIEVIAREGITAGTIGRIAKQAGQSKGSALYHIKNKAALYNGIIAHVYSLAGRRIGEAVQSQPTITKKVAAYISANLEFIFQQPQAILAVQHIVTNGPHFAQSGAGDQAVQALQSLLMAGQESGEFNTSFDPNIVALTIRQAIDAASYYIATHPTVHAETYSNEFTQLFMRSVKK